MSYCYICFVCHELIDPEIADIHSLPNGEDCHEACCFVCNNTVINN
jgi:hypothetical protein